MLPEAGGWGGGGDCLMGMGFIYRGGGGILELDNGDGFILLIDF